MTTGLNNEKIDERSEHIWSVYDWYFEVAEVLNFQIHIGKVSSHKIFF